MTVAIDVKELSKKYIISHLNIGAPSSLRELVTQSVARFRGIESVDPELSKGQGRSTKEDFWALRDISFQVMEGERVAIIGSNGAGKSTLLKIFSRITEPTSGEVIIRGKVASLLEVGTGFHPELSGRENVFLNGAILGMSRSEIRRKFDTIVQFSGVEKFIDTPVKHYSSGMYVRLAFSVSAWLDPDILIVDEVLSVGDHVFQKRCAERMKALTGDGRTVLFVSHSMAAVRTMCEKALYLKNGEVVSFTPVDDATVEYMRSLQDDSTEVEWHLARLELPAVDVTLIVECSDYIQFSSAEVVDATGQVTPFLDIDKPFQIVLHYQVLADCPFKVVPNFHFYDEQGGRYFISFPENVAPRTVGEFTAICNIDPFQFNVGRYSVMLVMSSYEMENPNHFAAENALRFEIEEPNNADPRRHGWTGSLPGVTRPRLNWEYVSD